ncbi:unnamed protein product [Prorocentrum cordatum]|uniref:Uncharacterized protein n=1 Tax=Prorocentrum cordatum TaxID=2364126 RepID=A0ABN9RTN6_9DINO|nr:unnamed protein product [Polarella glacialis]
MPPPRHAHMAIGSWRGGVSLSGQPPSASRQCSAAAAARHRGSRSVPPAQRLAQCTAARHRGSAAQCTAAALRSAPRQPLRARGPAAQCTAAAAASRSRRSARSACSRSCSAAAEPGAGPPGRWRRGASVYLFCDCAVRWARRRGYASSARHS